MSSVGDTLTFDAPVWDSCMYPDEMSFTYEFMNQDYSNDLISWVTLLPSGDLQATVTQAEFDRFCGTTFDTYQSVTVWTTVRAKPDWNGGLNSYAYFEVYFKNPTEVACQTTELIIP